MQFPLNMDREKLNKISKYCKKMKYLEENKEFSEDYKRAVLEQIKKMYSKKESNVGLNCRWIKKQTVEMVSF